jgi:hypothetical protein
LLRERAFSQTVYAAAACCERFDEAALFAAVSVGADVTLGAPTMA